MSGVAALQTAALATAIDEEESVRLVRATLKGPVVQTLRKLVPELAHVQEALAYDHTLGNIPLLETCFKTFREYRHQFNHVLVDPKGQVVKDDTAFLACGHNLEQVVAMVVRTSARRYFRHHVRPSSEPANPSLASPPVPLKGLFGRMKTHIVPGKSKLRTAAEELYDSIKGYLLFEWQVPLVPTYAKLAPAQVESLGKKLLDYGDVIGLSRAAGLPVPDSVKSFVAMPSLAERKKAVSLKPSSNSAAPQPKIGAAAHRSASEADASRLSSSTPKIAPISSSPSTYQMIPAPAVKPSGQIVPIAPLGPRQVAGSASPRGAAPAASSGGKKLSGESFMPILELPHVQAVLHPSLIGPHSAVIIDKVAPKAWALLVLTMGLRRKDQLAVLLLTAYGTLGREGFERYFSQNAEPGLLEDLIENTHPSVLGADSQLADVVAFSVNGLGARSKSA
ncbi:MAG: hypothetical protein HQL45_05195 [Alphaproteobacteria bacterium]|nr:hypothetical protein [Alphaproteobacteria bacterium]